MNTKNNASNHIQECLRQEEPTPHPTDKTALQRIQEGKSSALVSEVRDGDKTKAEAPCCMFQRGVFVAV